MFFFIIEEREHYEDVKKPNRRSSTSNSSPGTGRPSRQLERDSKASASLTVPLTPEMMQRRLLHQDSRQPKRKTSKSPASGEGISRKVAAISHLQPSASQRRSQSPTTSIKSASHSELLLSMAALIQRQEEVQTSLGQLTQQVTTLRQVAAQGAAASEVKPQTSIAQEWWVIAIVLLLQTLLHWWFSK